MQLFQSLGIQNPILNALSNEGYTRPTTIQQEAIPIVLKGRDMLACAQTGTGKTAAFAAPILQKLFSARNHQNGKRTVRTLVVCPTRELAIQVAESFTVYGKGSGIRNTTIYGGVSQKHQVKALRKGVDIVVATPGRLLDLIGQGHISLGDVEYLVLDEADRMLDMGFIPDIRKIIANISNRRQTLFFSATMPKEIVRLSTEFMQNAKRVSVRPQQTTAELIRQAVYHVPKRNKTNLLVHLLKAESHDSTLVFSRTKRGVDKLVRRLKKQGIRADAIHGDKSQNARQRALGKFKKGRTNVLVATNVAARGIDVEELSLVVNYDLPDVAETYVHRIGRTGRAETSGLALTFCDPGEKKLLNSIQKLIGEKINVVHDHPFKQGSSNGHKKRKSRKRRKGYNKHHRRN